MISQFTNRYPVSKTLRFELIPVGKTQENIERKGIIAADTKLAESYKKMKKTIDEFHKYFIDIALEGAKLTGLEEYRALYTAGAEEKKTKEHQSDFSAVKSLLRKEIVARFKAQSTFQILDKKELIQKELDKWITKYRPDLFYDNHVRIYRDN